MRGIINMLHSLRQDVPATHIACIFDAAGPTFRDTLYADYKAQRNPMPDDLRAQIAPIHHIVQLLGWPVLSVPGVEADDVIGTLAVTAERLGWNVVISSGDKDLAQLVTPHIRIIDTLSGKTRDVAGVQAEFGVPPHLMIDLQTLVGDAVDNVPGVPKVGPKIAAQWLNEHGSLDTLIAKADSIKGVRGENLRQSLSWLPQTRALVTIKTDCDLSGYVANWPALDDIILIADDALDKREIYHFYQTYGFKTLARQLEASLPHLPSSPSVSPSVVALGSTGDLFPEARPVAPTVSLQVDTITDWASLGSWLARIDTAALTALDTETTSLHGMQAHIVGLSLCVAAGHAAYIPLMHDYPDAPPQLPRDEVLAKLRPWLENPQRPKLGQHITYDRHVLANHGIAVQGYVHDTMLQSYVLEVHKPHNLQSLAERHLGRSGISYENLCGKGVHQIPFSQVAIDQAAVYAAEDAEQTLAVHRILHPQIQADAGLAAVYALEIACSDVLLQIERHGVLIDAPTLARQSHELGQRLLALEQEAYELAGQRFNLNSPKQLAEILFDQLGLPVAKKTATGARSTNEDVLEKLAAEGHELPAKLLTHRSLSKLKSTYTDKLAGMAHPRTGRVHTHYAQAAVVTGRLSSNEPNLQNIPIRTTEGRRVREAFVAPAGHVIASADYSQIELRIMAHLSQDEALLRAFATGVDVHRATAAEVFDVPPEAVSAEQRRCAKTINFGLIYGMSSFGLAQALGLDNTAAKHYIERYFERYPGVKRYMDETRTLAKTQGYVQTVMGRRLYLPEINSPNGPRRAAAERAAINAPMQGTAADLIKLSMVAVQRAITQEQRASRIVMQVHDELVFEVPEAEIDWLNTEVPRLMADVAQLAVPLLAEVGIGHNWEQAH